MCNRYAFINDLAMLDILSKLGGFWDAQLKPRYNIAPTHLAPAIRSTAKGNRLEMMRWGLSAPGSENGTQKNYHTVARAETVHQRHAFRLAIKSRRCVIPASGFYEWRKEGRVKQPYYFYRKDEKPLLFAGIYEPWTSPDGKVIKTFAIVTTEPNELVASIHDRMPVFVAWEAAPFWLDSLEENPEKLLPLMKQLPADQMAMHHAIVMIGL